MLPTIRKRVVATAVVAGLALAVMPLALPAAYATPNATAERLAGDDRFETAALIAEDTFPQGATNAIIAFGLNFPDALAASYLAGFVNGPILLTQTNTVPAVTIDALEDLGVETCYIVGGTHVVGTPAESRLDEECNTVRIAGDDRYETAADIATSPPDANVGDLGTKGRTAIVATGERFADALAAGPIAAGEDFPVLLTRPATLSSEASNALDNLDIDHVLIPGGTQAVSAAVEAEIEEKGITVQRFAGSDRHETAVLLAKFSAEELGDDLTHVNVASGTEASGGADALALAPHGAVESPTLLCENSSTCGEDTLDFVEQNSRTIASIHIAGGFARISQNAEDELVRAARTAPAGSPTITRAEAVNDTTVRLTMSEVVESFGGGALDARQFTYDADGSATGSAPATATSASIGPDGRTITVTFASGVVKTGNSGDTLTYNDGNDSAPDAGDVVDADDNPLRDQTVTVANPTSPAGAPTMTSAIVISGSQAVVTFSEPVQSSSGPLDPAQFEYTPGQQEGQGLPGTPATGIALSADRLQAVLTFPAGTLPTDPLRSESPFDGIVYTDDANTQGDVIDASGTPMEDHAVSLDPASPPSVQTASASTTSITVRFDEAVRGYGGDIDEAQWRYDADGAGPVASVAPVSSSLSGDGTSITLNFGGGVLDPGADNDTLTYSDSQTAEPETGDVVDLQGAQVEPVSVAVGDGTAPAPTPPTVQGIEALDTSRIRLYMSENVVEVGNVDGGSQFSYDPDGGGAAPAVNATSAEATGDIVTLTFPAGTVVPTSGTDTLRYSDNATASTENGDISDGAGAQLANFGPAPVADGTAGGPELRDADALSTTQILVFLSESVDTDTIGAAQFTYDTNTADTTVARATSAQVQSDPSRILLTFPAGTVVPGSASDQVAYTDDADDTNDVEDREGNELADGAVPVDDRGDTAGPDMTSAQGSGTTVVVTFNEPVFAFGGGDLDPTQFKYDNDPLTPFPPAVPAAEAEIDPTDNRRVILTFEAPIGEFPGGQLRYEDPTGGPDPGDVTDAFGNPAPTQGEQLNA